MKKLTGPLQYLMLKDHVKEKPMIEMTPFQEVLGDDLPDIELNRIGEFRLKQALRRRFGVGYRNVGQARDLLEMFERHMKMNKYRESGGGNGYSS